MDRALELAPNEPIVLGNASILKGQMGEIDEAVRLLERSMQIDPLHQTLLFNLGIRYLQAGRLEDAESSLERLLVVNPDYLAARGFLGDVMLLQRRPKAALEFYQLEESPIESGVGQAMAYHDLSDQSASDGALREINDAFGDDGAFAVARVHAYRGETDQAFDWLERAFDQKIWAVGGAKADWALASLHDDPRWEPFLQKMGLAD